MIFEHQLGQFKWFRKWRRGKWYLMGTNLPMAPFWTKEKFTNCQAKVIKEEDWG